jgi:hypothetical protein
MIGIVILNFVLAAFVIVGVLGLLAWGIVTDRAWTASVRRRSRRVARARVAYARPQAQAAQNPA